MRRILILTALLSPQAASAHVGHLGEIAGHSHWIALGALGIASVIGALAAGKRGRKSGSEEAQDESEDATDGQEAAA